jgi:glycogen debranching enzyme
MSAIESLHNRIDLTNIPFTDRGSRILLSRQQHELSIRLAERWLKWESEFGPYRTRTPLINHFRLLDEVGNALEFQTDSYPHSIILRTAVGNFEWAFADTETLLLRLPPGRFGLTFEVFAHQAMADRRGGTLHGNRNVAYTTNANLLTNTIESPQPNLFCVTLLIDAHADDLILLNITPRLGFNRSLHHAEDVIHQSRTRWESWLGAAPPVLDIYRRQYEYAWWIMRAGLLSPRYFFTREALAPSKIHYVGVWHWDQFFHALAYRHVDPVLAEDQLRILIDHQRADGMLPDAIHDEGLITHLTKPVDADVTKPPLLAWAALKIYETSAHLDFLQEIYAPLVRWQNWWIEANCDTDGLALYRHPFSSGLDDSPLWDDGMPVIAPDLNTYLCIQADSLARIAELIGEHKDAGAFRADADRRVSLMIAQMWDEGRGIFRALRVDPDGKKHPIDVLTPFSLLPLWTGRLPMPIAERLITHLTDPAEFWSQWPLATVALNDPKFDSKQMWRGPTWVNINYMFIEALERIDHAVLASELRRKTLDMIRRLPDIYEYYDPLTGDRPPKAAPIFGWTTAVYIELAIQETVRASQQTR